MATSCTCVRLRERAEASATDPAQLPVLIVSYEYPPLGVGAGVPTAALAAGIVTRGARVGVEAGA